MSGAGIELVYLVPSPDGYKAFAEGSAIMGTSSFLRTDGTTSLAADVTLASRSTSPGFF